MCCEDRGGGAIPMRRDSSWRSAISRYCRSYSGSVNVCRGSASFRCSLSRRRCSFSASRSACFFTHSAILHTTQTPKAALAALGVTAARCSAVTECFLHLLGWETTGPGRITEETDRDSTTENRVGFILKARNSS